ncbi:oxidoreductase [Photobacterium sp. SDRW27]|uniref:molybdopterin-dependent oxidoreductase n=1 Tax=Photobacterium obscurum TaxID=2829490 RepID=UPI0022433481|nr:molybdopterin-dependent oxidoreductase [Photobacterium obscurum]MCW8327435.1 oxidoreductase [Photobacterium obscurum]
MSIRLSFTFARFLALTLLCTVSNAVLAYETTITLEGKNTSGQPVEVILTRSQIEQLPQSTLTTHLPWFKGQAEFQGVKLKTLLETYQLKSSQITMGALNDYSATVSWNDIDKYDPVVAIKKDGQYLRIRDYGPYWLVFSIDKYPELKQMKYLAKMVWQLETIQAE